MAINASAELSVLQAVAQFLTYAVMAVFAENAVFFRALGVSRLNKLVNDPKISTWQYCIPIILVQTFSAPMGWAAQSLTLPALAKVLPGWLPVNALRPPTADYGTTLALALITFFMIRFNKAKHQSLKEIWTGMCSPLPPWLPLWAPINNISEIAIPISLSLRLFANVLSGTVIMALVYGLLGVIATAWPAALHVYFDLFSGAIQTYVFCMLTMTYVSQACGED